MSEEAGFWLYCPACKRAWPVAPSGDAASEQRFITMYEPRCPWRCPDPDAVPPKVWPYVCGQRTPFRIRDDLDAVNRLGGYEATRPVIERWLAQVLGECPSSG